MRANSPKLPEIAGLVKSRNTRANHRGVALIMVLLFLVAITGLTVWAARQSMLGEGISRNQQELEVARQAAESALRDAERDINNVTSLGTPSCSRGGYILPSSFNNSCTGGLCYMRDANYAISQWTTATSGSTANSEPWWPAGKGGLWNNTFSSKPIRTPATASTNCSFTGGVPLGTYTGAPAILGVALQPEYVIEYFKRTVPARKEMAVYRITARGFGYTQRTQVVLQTVFLPE
jgi:type IV pilus assembly protein PilX